MVSQQKNHNVVNIHHGLYETDGPSVTSKGKASWIKTNIHKSWKIVVFFLSWKSKKKTTESKSFGKSVFHDFKFLM